MTEPVNAPLVNGDHKEPELQTKCYPSISIQFDSGDDQERSEQMENSEPTELSVHNYGLPEVSHKSSDCSPSTHTKASRSARKRGFLASELSNSETGTLFTTSPSGTTPSPASPVSSSSSSSGGSLCHRNEGFEKSKFDETEFESSLAGKRARCTLPQDYCYPIINSSSGSCNSDIITQGSSSKCAYQSRSTTASDQRSFPALSVNSPSICYPSDPIAGMIGFCPRLSKTTSPGEVKASATHSVRPRQSKVTNKSSGPQSLTARLAKREIPLHDSGGADDDCDHEVPGGSELTIAAYNNFVRRVVDDTLDRNITFCEQPRHAITALENICARAWPNLDMKRHRNRIRAYLKACRRNSKKNRGQINMKEPAMNGLSIEARQLVSNALNLVAMDVEQLKMMIQDNTKFSFPPTSSSPGSSKGTIDTSYLMNSSPFGTKPKKADVIQINTNQHALCSDLCNLPNGLSQSAEIDKDNHAQLNSILPHPSRFQELAFSHLSDSYSQIPFGISELSSASNVDANYMAAMLRILPTLMHSNKHYSSPVSQSSYDNMLPSHMNGQISVKTADQCSKTEGPKVGTLNNFSVPQLPQSCTNYSDLTMDNRDTILPEDFIRNYHQAACEFGAYSSHNNSETHKHGLPTSSNYLEPPPAHINCVQYSPSLQEAIGKLLGLDVCLTHEDTTYFRHNLGLAKEAIKYAKAFSHMIMNKLHVLELQLQQPTRASSFFTEYHPLNLS